MADDLVKAAETCQFDNMLVLVASGVDPNQRNRSGRVALPLVAYRGNARVLKVFME